MKFRKIIFGFAVATVLGQMGLVEPFAYGGNDSEEKQKTGQKSKSTCQSCAENQNKRLLDNSGESQPSKSPTSGNANEKIKPDEENVSK